MHVVVCLGASSFRLPFFRLENKVEKIRIVSIHTRVSTMHILKGLYMLVCKKQHVTCKFQPTTSLYSTCTSMTFWPRLPPLPITVWSCGTLLFLALLLALLALKRPPSSSSSASPTPCSLRFASFACVTFDRNKMNPAGVTVTW